MNTHSSRVAEAWQAHQSEFGVPVTYVSAAVSTDFTAIVQGRNEMQSRDESWDVAARQIEVFVSAADAPAECAIREDYITTDGLSYVVIERQPYGNGLYRYLCERAELDVVTHRGRTR